jgi:hypothetical protein
MSDLTPAESRDLRCIAGMMIPASAEFDVPGADDAVIFADIVGTMGRDTAHVREALGALAGVADQDAARRGGMRWCWRSGNAAGRRWRRCRG